MAEKNIAALLDSMACTVHVVYQHGGEQQYTYISNLPELSVGDFVVVPTTVRTEKYVRRPDDDDEGYKISGNAGIRPELRDAAQRILRGQRLTIAKITQIDECVDIPPDDPIEYKWVISKVDLSAYTALVSRNKQITEAVQSAYQRNIRKSFAERIIGELPDSDKANLLQLLGK